MGLIDSKFNDEKCANQRFFGLMVIPIDECTDGYKFDAH